MHELRTLKTFPKSKHNVVLYRAVSEHSIRSVLKTVNKFGGLIRNKTLNSISNEVYYIVSNNEGVPVGVTGYKPRNDWCVEQLNTAIIPTFRGKGYGRDASALLLNYLKSVYGKVFCTINSKNKIMLAIKAKQGFIIEGELKSHFASERDIFILSKISTKRKQSYVEE